MPRYIAPPAVEDQPSYLTNLWLEGRTYRGDRSRAYSILGVASSSESVPGIVLLHGGGGSAYWRWVQQWVERGYAAIAVDTSWRVPVAGDEAHGEPVAHEWPGPPPWDGTFAQPVEGDEQWLTHVMQLIDAARQVLAEHPNVDASRIGLMGVSWGGFLTCIAASKLPGFACAVSVYGCGFLTEESAWSARGEFDLHDAARIQAWTEAWDPSSWLSRASVPILFLTGTNDDPYPLVSCDRSAELAPRATRSFQPGLGHGHAEAWLPHETWLFMNSVLFGGSRLPQLHGATMATGSQLHVTYDAQGDAKARLLCTSDTGAWPARRWKESEVALSKKHAMVAIPDEATAWFVNVIDDRGATASSRLFQR